MAKMQDVLDLAREDLNDDEKIRWSDSDLLKHANDALLIAKAVRGDLFIGSLGTPLADLVLTDTFPLPLVYRRAVADYVTGRASMIDAEEALDGRASAYLSTYQAALGVST